MKSIIDSMFAKKMQVLAWDFCLLLIFCSLQVRKFVVGFVEEACKKDTELLPKVKSIFMFRIVS
jgi:hypothetical protein